MAARFPTSKEKTVSSRLSPRTALRFCRTSTAVKGRCEAAGAFASTCVFHFNPYRSLFSRAEPDFYAAVTDAHIIYPWEIDRGIKGELAGMGESN